MRSRQKTSSGQAIVLVTLALFAMAGMMGLAVDLGWSFFVQKEAQAAADGSALAAVQEAVVRIRAAGGSISGFDCAASGTGATEVDCEAPISCDSVASTSNLNNGCQYAKKNGFDWSANSRQSVTMQSNAVKIVAGVPTNAPPMRPGVTSPVNISYWVTVKSVETIPQLFSAVLGNSTGTVSAISTAAIAGSVVPGSFFGMDHAGDCFVDASGTQHCGLDVFTGTGNGQLPCPGAPGGSANLCAPAGIILASNCGSSSDPGCTQAYAGSASGPGAYGSSLLISTGGAVTGNWTPSTPAPTSDPSKFLDPTSPNPQPSLTTPGNVIGTCAIGHDPGQSSQITGTVGPYLYYAYNNTAGKATPDGTPIVMTGTVTFKADAKCPSDTTVSSNQTNNDFPTYIFYGGVQNAGTMDLGPGQYVMAGTGGGSCGGASGPTVFCASSQGAGGTVIQPDPNQPAAVDTGTMFITTDSQYPGLDLPAMFPALNQGAVYLKNSDVTMYGLVSSANGTSALPQAQQLFQGIVWWQDRRNSEVGYSQDPSYAGCSDTDCKEGDNGTVIYCNIGCPDSPGYPGTPTKLTTMLTANHVTATSPGVTLDPGKANVALNGVFYQPRGAWMEFVDGNAGGSCSGSSNCPLQVVTGALYEDTGDTGLLLEGPTNPLLTFKATLIQ